MAPSEYDLLLAEPPTTSQASEYDALLGAGEPVTVSPPIKFAPASDDPLARIIADERTKIAGGTVHVETPLTNLAAAERAKITGPRAYQSPVNLSEILFGPQVPLAPSEPYVPPGADAIPTPRADSFDVSGQGIGSAAVARLGHEAITSLGDILFGAAALSVVRPALRGDEPAQVKMEWINSSSDPLLQWARQTPKLAEEAFPVNPAFAKNPLVQAAGSTGPFVPMLAAGPFAPFVMAMQDAGQHITNDYKSLVQSGLPEEEAAQQTFHNATAAGLTDEIVWSVLPAPLRAAGDRFLIDKFGAEGVKRFLLGRVAQAGEGAVLGATSRIAQNSATGEPLFEGIGSSAGGLALLQAFMPRGRTAAERTPRLADILFPQPKPPVSDVATPVEVTATAREIFKAAEEATTPREIARSFTGEPIEQAPKAEAVAPETPTVTELADKQKYPVVELPVSELKLSKDVPNFKENADKSTGVVEGQELQGKYNRLGTGAVTVWERNDGTNEVISGRHRLDLARRSGEETIPSQVVRESDGFSKEDAITFDAEANIRDGQGSVSDYANYFRHTEVTPEEASSRGLLARDKGRKGFAIGKYAGDDLYALYRAGKLTENKAAAIAEAARDNPDLQGVGIRASQSGASLEEIRGQIEAAQNAAPRASAKQSDFFADTSLGETWKEQGKYVAARRKELKDIIATRKAILNKYEAATSTGSISAQVEAAGAELNDAQTKLDRWNEWGKHPDLRAEVETLGQQKASEVPTLRPGENQGDLLSKQTEDLTLSGEKGTDFATRAAAEEVAAAQKSEYDALIEAAQGKLFEPAESPASEHDWTGATARVSERGFQDFGGRYSREQDTPLPPGGKETASDKLKPGDVIRAPSFATGQIVEKTVAKIEAAPGMKLSAQQKITFTDGSEVHTVGGRKWKVYERKREQLRRQKDDARESAPTEAEKTDLQSEQTKAASVAEEAPSKLRLSRTAGQAAAIPNPLASPIVAKALKTIAIRKMSPLDAATTERSARLQQSFADAERAQKEIRKAAPTERRQAAISVWMEANGDAQTLAQWAAAAKGKAFRQAATDAQSLTPAELAIAKKTRAAFDVLEKRGNTYDVLSNHRDNYVPHVWDVTKDFSGIGTSKLQDRFKFNKARTFNNLFEGDQAGFTPKTRAIGKLLPAYLHEMNKVIADRQFIQNLADRTASDGRPLVIPRGTAKTVDASDWIIRNADGSPLPKFRKAVYDTEAEAKAALQPGQMIEKRPSESALVNPRGFAKAEDAQGNPIDQRDYKIVDQPALNNWRWVETDANGNSTILKSDLAVHPELAKRLNATMGQSAIRQWYNEPSTGVSVIPKAIAKGLDTAQSVMKREMFSLLAPFHQVQESTHAIGHTVNPFGGLEDMSRPTPEHIDAMQHGLMLLPDRSSSAAYLEGLGGRGGFIAQAGRWLGEKAGENVIGKAADRIASVVDGYQDYLFHQFIPSLKLKTYQHILERNMGRYADDLKAGNVSEADVKLLSAEQTNAAYGHLNYGLLDRNPTMRHITQLALLAPDFLEARGRFVAQAAKSLIGEKAGHEQFRAIAVLAAAQAATMFTLSQVLGGEWDWKHPFEMTVGNRRYMLRSVPEDLHRLLFQGPDVRREFVSARVNPTLQKVDQLRTGLNYRGEKTGALETLGELFANYIPITARWLPGMRQLTETSRNSPVSPLEQLAGSLGLKISRYSAITHTHQLASEWMDKQKIERPAGVYPTSKFTPLRYALEDADLPRAEKEWKKLVGDEGDEKKLSEGFKQSITHPFTGNKSRDEDFANSLKGKDRLLYDRALEVREGILEKFGLIR